MDTESNDQWGHGIAQAGLDGELAIAIDKREHDAVKTLISRKADINRKMRGHENALSYAFRHSNSTVIQTLLDAKAKILKDLDDGGNFLHNAASNRDTSLMDYLPSLFSSVSHLLFEVDDKGKLPLETSNVFEKDNTDTLFRSEMTRLLSPLLIAHVTISDLGLIIISYWF